MSRQAVKAHAIYGEEMLECWYDEKRGESHDTTFVALACCPEVDRDDSIFAVDARSDGGVPVCTVFVRSGACGKYVCDWD